MKLNKTMAALLPIFMASHSLAAQQADGAHAADLSEVVVIGEAFAQKMGTQRITQQQIQRRATRNGSISELLRDNLNVQFSSTDGSAGSAGEIAPENVSFHGEKFYDNSWMIDGMSNNDTTNPGADKGAISTDMPDGATPFDLPAGGTQSFWINSGIIDRADVYDSNISAKYGRFTGGVVDARLKDPDTDKASGSVEYRTSRDSWVNYHSDDPAFQTADELTKQPKFTKHIYSVNINQPLNAKAGVLFSYNRTQSSIPYYHSYMKAWENQKRLSETYLLKGLYQADSGDRFKLTAMYSPHASTYIKQSTLNSRYTNNGGGYRINGEWVHLFDNGQVETYLGYKHSQNKIEHDGKNYYSWYNADGVFDWCSNAGCSLAGEGGYGDYETANNTWTLKQGYSFDPKTIGASEHILGLGWQAERSKAHYRRDQNSYAYAGSKANIVKDDSLVCVLNDDACIDGQFYFKKRTAYYAKNISVDNDYYAAYLQDTINWRKWQFTPGVRISRDGFLKNTNIAPRLTASYDMFGDKNTRIFGGLNRYYAANMLAYKLREATGGQAQETRADNRSAWLEGEEKTSSARRYLHNDSLKTPHSDEINLGVQQRWGNGLWTLKWVQRHGRDQFGRQKVEVGGSEYKMLNNRGFSKSNTFSLEGKLLKPWQFKYAQVDIRGGANYMKSRSNTDTYDDSLGDDDLNKRIIVEGELLGIGDVPKTDYNTPWRLYADITTEFPRLWNLRWTNTVNYTAGYSSWDSQTVNCDIEAHAACGSYIGEATEYTKLKYKNALTFDWRLSIDVPVFRKNKLTVNADIINVFDHVIKTKGSASKAGTSRNVAYKLGRQYWLGARYTW